MRDFSFEGIFSAERDSLSLNYTRMASVNTPSRDTVPLNNGAEPHHFYVALNPFLWVL
jgi:hypothetical protein